MTPKAKSIALSPSLFTPKYNNYNIIESAKEEKEDEPQQPVNSRNFSTIDLKTALNNYLHGKKTRKDYEQYEQLRKDINRHTLQLKTQRYKSILASNQKNRYPLYDFRQSNDTRLTFNN